jgi:hypothetical protein
MSGAGPVTTIRENVTQRHYVTAVSFYEGPPRFVCTVVDQLGSSTENDRRQIYGSLRTKRGHSKNQNGSVVYGRYGKGPAPKYGCCPNSDTRSLKLGHCAWTFAHGRLMFTRTGLFQCCWGRPRWDPPVTRRVPELERPQQISPLGPFL